MKTKSETTIGRIEILGASKSYHSRNGAFTALQEIDLEIESGSFVAIIGKSGSGKSTLLNLISGIDRPTTGEIQISGTPTGTFNEDELSAFRGRNIGVVFQSYQLIPTLTILENVTMPMDFCSVHSPSERTQKAMRLLANMEVDDQAKKFPATLSGGQQQRVAIARALANEPRIIVADEPTGNLDSDTAKSVMEIFEELSRSGITIVIVTHDSEVAERADRVINIVDGKIA